MVGLMGPFRFALVRAVLWEFPGCEHLVSGNPVKVSAVSF